MHKKIVVVIPTYNEAENISRLIDSIFNLGMPLEVLVVDDNSPDGTWKIVSEKSKTNRNLHLLNRTKDRGRGKAGIAGFKEALKLGADYVIEMDGDFSHDPVFIPGFINAIDTADVVLGSRYIKGGRDNRGFVRRLISRTAGLYIRLILGFKVKDPTSGYRCFTKDIIERINPDSLEAGDPFIVTEVLYRCYKNNARITEIPIGFSDRKEGKSKLGLNVLLANLWKVVKLQAAG